MKCIFLWVAGLMGCLTVLASQDRPNVVWLVTEDNSSCWYRLYNENGAAMPNVERLAKDGLVFNHAYSCAPVCSVARSTIISGCYAPRVGVQYHRNQVPVAMPEGLRYFPWYLRQEGYYTSNNSKEDYNFLPSDNVDVWDESSKTASYRNRKSGQPFFHVQNFFHTHEGRLFKDVSDSELKNRPEDVELFPYHPDTPTFRNKYALYLDKHEQVDAQLGEFIQQLEEDGLMDDTFIFHYGDHGGVLPGSKGYIYNDGLQVAMVVYVPKNWQHLVPAERGSRIDGKVQFVDLSATVLNLAGADIPEGLDGKPFLGNGVELDELNSRDFAFGYAERFDEKMDVVRTIHKGRYHYMRNYQPFNFDGLHAFYRYRQPAFVEWRELHKAGKLNAAQSRFFEARPPEMLFDLEKDPHEVNNLADDPAYASILKDMRKVMQHQVESMPDLGFIPENVIVGESNGNNVAYGQQQKDRIQTLVEIADLQISPFPEAKARIKKALNSKDELERYWGLITCSAFGKQAAPFYAEAREMAASDESRLNRVRAAEFLALTGQADPEPVLVEVLNEVTDPIEANLILNTVVLLRDGRPGYDFDVSKVKDAAWHTDDKKMQAVWRVEYLESVRP